MMTMELVISMPSPTDVVNMVIFERFEEILEARGLPPENGPLYLRLLDAGSPAIFALVFNLTPDEVFENHAKYQALDNPRLSAEQQRRDALAIQILDTSNSIRAQARDALNALLADWGADRGMNAVAVEVKEKQ